MSRTKRIAFPIASITIGFALILLTLEAIFRLLPTAMGARMLAVHEKQPIAQFMPNREFVWSRDWDLKYPTRNRVNNAGFIHDGDYDPNATSPLLAIIGDSYIEALTVPHDRTVQGRLAKAVEGHGRVYSFARSGAPLSQYLMWADFVRRTYRPDALVVSVVSNDFDESLLHYQRQSGSAFPGYFYFENIEGELRLTLVPYWPSRLKDLIRHSALVRYLFFNLRVQNISFGETFSARTWGTTLDWLVSPANARHIIDPHPHHTMSGEDLLTRERWSRRAVDKFFELLPKKSGLPANRIVLAVDGLRDGIYETGRLPGAKMSFFGRMRTYLMSQARQRGFEVIDLHEPMRSAFNSSGKRMEFQHDWHWSTIGHGVLAHEVRGTSAFRALFPQAAYQKRRSRDLISAAP